MAFCYVIEKSLWNSLYCEWRSEPNRAYLKTCDLEMIIVMSSNPHFICRENMEKKEKLHVEGRDLYLVSK